MDSIFGLLYYCSPGRRLTQTLPLPKVDFDSNELYMNLVAAIVSCVCDLEVFVIGGGVSAAGQIILDAVRKAFVRHAFPAAEKTRFELAALGNDAGICGAARLVLE